MRYLHANITPTLPVTAGSIQFLLTVGKMDFCPELQPPAARDSFRLVGQMNVTFLTIVQSACLFQSPPSIWGFWEISLALLLCRSALAVFLKGFIFSPFHHCSPLLLP